MLVPLSSAVDGLGLKSRLTKPRFVALRRPGHLAFRALSFLDPARPGSTYPGDHVKVGTGAFILCPPRVGLGKGRVSSRKGKGVLTVAGG